MKLFALLLLSAFLSKNCSSQTKNNIKTAVLEYTASTRGFYQKITVQDQSFTVSNDRSGNYKSNATKISDKNWNELIGYFENIKLDSLVTLKAPTKKRLYDGAAIGNFKIVYKGKIYETTSFDDGYPPSEIKKIVDKINSFTNRE